jgi:hypothetical protein
VAELADALDSGSSSRKGVEVQVLSSAPKILKTYVILSCGPQKLCPSLRSLLFQAIFVMQAAEDRCRFDSVSGRQPVPVAAGRNAGLGWFRNSRA